MQMNLVLQNRRTTLLYIIIYDKSFQRSSPLLKKMNGYIAKKNAHYADSE